MAVCRYDFPMASAGIHFFAVGGLVIAGVIAAVVLILAFVVIGIYNGIQRARVRCDNAFAQIDVQLKRRFDLIPNLIEVAKGYMAHERETLANVIAARNAAVQGLQSRLQRPTDPAAAAELDRAMAGMDGALGRLLAVAEAYPDLKANQNMLAVQEELSSTENRIAFARQAFNDAVMRFNEMIVVFPNNLLAGLFGFRQQVPFQADAAERASPTVRF